MKLMIVGAGMQGQVLTWNLARSEAVTEIALADHDPQRAEWVAARVGAGKAVASELDASDPDAVAAAAEGAALVINAVVPDHNLEIMRACLAVGSHYTDMASGQTRDKTIDEAFLDQLALDAEFKAAGLTALLSTGLDPGITNTFAGNAYEDLDSCFELRVKEYTVFESPLPLQAWSRETYYTDSAQPPLLYEEGAFTRVEPFDRREWYMFPQPFGLGPVVCHDHEEVSTLPRLLPTKLGEKGLRYVDFKSGMPEEQIDADKAFVESGMAGKEPVTLPDGRLVRPIDVFVATLPPNPPADVLEKVALSGQITDIGVVTVNAVGEKDGRPATIVHTVVPPDIKWVNERVPGATMVSYATSTAASIYAELLVAGRITATGVLAPEVLERQVRDDFLAECGRRGMPVWRRYDTQIN